MGEKTVHRIHEHVLPDETRYGRHHEKGGDDQNADRTLAPYRLIEKQRQRDAEKNRNDENTANDNKGGGNGRPE